MVSINTPIFCEMPCSAKRRVRPGRPVKAAALKHQKAKSHPCFDWRTCRAESRWLLAWWCWS